MELFKSRTRVAYTNAVGDKVYPVVVDIKKGIKSTEDIQFVSSDVNTGILSVAFISGNENFNVSGADVVCSVMRPDASTLELPCEVVGENIVEVPLGINGTSQDGVYSFDFKVLKGGNKVVGTPIMNYSVSLSIGNDIVVEEDDRLPVLTMLMTQVNELKDETRETINQANVATVSSREATANAVEATNNANAVSERVSQETATAISEIKRDTANAIASMNQSTSTAISNMNQSTNDAIDSMNQNTANAIADMTQKTDKAVTRVNDNLANINNVVTTKVAELDTAKSDMTTTVSNKVNEVETRFNALTSKQQQDAEVIDARDGETSLKSRLDRDIEKAKQVYVNVEGSNISTDSSSGYAKDVEILGNTVQDASNLADIRSVGDTVEGQELYEIPVVSCGKNLFNKVFKDALNNINGVTVDDGGVVTINGTFSPHAMFKVVIPKGEYRATTFSDSRTALHVFWNGGDNGFQHSKTLSYTEDTTLQCYIASGTYDNHICKFQLEEGTVATPYEPYVEDKLTILSPVQLEKVGDVRDRIIEKDGVWGVEKNVGIKYLKDIKFNSNADKETYYRIGNYGNPFPMMNTDIICDKYAVGTLSTESTQTQIMCYRHTEDRKEIILAIQKTDIPNISNINDLLNSIKEDNNYIKYVLNTPQFIPLPHDQQIKFRTFANKTNISFGCEIEGTIKAQVPKSLGATVNTHTEQINNLNKELDRVKKLEESTVSTVTTESDFTTVEATSNGYFEDVKLEGKTLVNLANVGIVVGTGSNTKYTFDGEYYSIQKTSGYTIGISFKSRNASLEANKTYTIIINNKSEIQTFLYNKDYAKISNLSNGVNIIKYTPSSSQVIRVGDVSSNSTEGLIKFSILILEGDHTQNPPSYFEGLKSVGQSASEDGVDEIVVASAKNLINNLSWELGTIEGDGGTESNSTSRIRSDFANISKLDTFFYDKGQDYKLVVRFYDENKSFIKIPQYQSFINDRGCHVIPDNAKYVRLVVAKQNDSIINVSDVQYIDCNIAFESDKKRLLYYNEETQTWEKPILRQWDSIEKHADGKYYYHQRSGEVVLDGSESWGVSNCINDKKFFAVNMNRLPIPSGGTSLIVNQICDRFAFGNPYMGEGDCAWVFTPSGVTEFVTVRIMLSSIEQTPSAIKTWLQANNVTVVYQLAKEKVYECTNIDLITYANETNYIVESGAIVPRSTLKVHNNISNVVKILQEKVSLLENKFIQGLKQVLAGDMYSLAELLYPEDFVEENPENKVMLLPFE